MDNSTQSQHVVQRDYVETTFKEEEPFPIFFLLNAVIVILVLSLAVYIFLKRNKNIVNEFLNNQSKEHNSALNIKAKKHITARSKIIIVEYKSQEYLIVESSNSTSSNITPIVDCNKCNEDSVAEK